MGNGGIHHKWTPAGNGDENVDTGKGSPRSLSEQLTHTRLTEIYATSGLIIEDKVIVEVKAITGNIPTVFELQVLSYLKASGYKVGLLINFGNQSCQVRRLMV